MVSSEGCQDTEKNSGQSESILKSMTSIVNLQKEFLGTMLWLLNTFGFLKEFQFGKLAKFLKCLLLYCNIYETECRSRLQAE